MNRIKIGFVTTTVAGILLSFAVLVLPSAYASAQEFDTSWDSGGLFDTSWDSGYGIDSSWSYPSIDTSWDTGYGVDSSWDSGPSFDTSWDSGTGSFIPGSSEYFDTSWDSGSGAFIPGTLADDGSFIPGTLASDGSFIPGTLADDGFIPGTLASGDCTYGCYTDEYGVGYSYSPGYGYGSSYGGFGSYGYSTPRIASMPVYAPGYSAPRTVAYTQPTSQPTVRPVQQQQQQQQQQQSGGQPINNTNVNTNTNTAPVTPVYTTPPQHLVQYVSPQTYSYPNYVTYPSYQYPSYQYPTYYPTQQNTYCTITASPTSVQNGQAAYLSWTSYGASSAWLSDGLGVVASNGSLTVRPNVSTTYTLTVSGYGGTRTCQAYVNVSGAYPYVSLTQIPYTGLDFGAFGNAVYWLGLLSFAISGAYLVLYYRGGAANFAHSILGSRRTMSASAEKAPAMFSRAVAPSYAKASEGKPKASAPVRAEKRSLENLPVARTMQAPKDSMTFAAATKEGENPRIIVTRS